MINQQEFIKKIPKVELHLHIEGSLEPELMFKLAARNKIELPYASVEALKEAYQFNNLQEFLDLYYQGAEVLQTEQDFYDLAWAYFEICHRDNVLHTEVFFDPQTHTERGIAMATVINGLTRAKQQAEKQYGISCEYILCFLRHLSEASAIQTLEAAKPFLAQIIGVGLDSSEQGHPPEKFQRVFSMAKQLGLRRVAHAGEEGPASNVASAWELLDVSRIDHGVRCLEDAALVKQLARVQMPLTVCPFSNVKLNVVEHLSDHPLPSMIAKGLAVTINSDDPAYFGGYLLDNLQACSETFNWDRVQIAALSYAAVTASYASEVRKSELSQLIDNCLAEFSQ
ncbi:MULTISPECIES: adenosine deaminase [unclassified Agarivorans]|uniref:adenosine deaminase n=1 Tax=unclassified Agarivorans TaxID=2636026 RepID=UPI0026E2E75D|nr:MULTISPECIES: adenosine deaminase [unclassified Agarivorans]MDO6684877.1 adenosine deaminase [Agarivorans sp. 3_MG-2023]MDO6714962.1 adenosine deaminase [Agarivorans sp. 2_MG-2023]